MRRGRWMCGLACATAALVLFGFLWYWGRREPKRITLSENRRPIEERPSVSADRFRQNGHHVQVTTHN